MAGTVVATYLRTSAKSFVQSFSCTFFGVWDSSAGLAKYRTRCKTQYETTDGANGETEDETADKTEDAAQDETKDEPEDETED